MDNLSAMLAGLERSVERFSKAADAYIPVLIRKRQAAEQERRVRQDAEARAAARKAFVETYAPIVETIWKIVMKKLGHTH